MCSFKVCAHSKPVGRFIEYTLYLYADTRMLQCKSNQLYEILAYANIGNIGISAITNIGVSAYRQKCHIGTPLLNTIKLKSSQNL